MYRRNGFTLIELMVVLAIVGLTLSLAVPRLRGSVAAGHTAAETAALSETLLQAMDQSTISGNKVVVCASDDGNSCNGSVDWTPGWIAFEDADGDRSREPGEALLHAHPRLPHDVRLRSSTGRTRIVFQPHGGVNAGSNVTFTFCDSRGASKASTMVLANSARMRTGTASSKQAEACLGQG